jgi:hypothetical protein
MSVLSFCLVKLQRRAPAAKDADSPMVSHGEPCDAPRECETPLSFAELIAASSFLDFGGMLDERWLSGRAPDERDAGCCK